MIGSLLARLTSGLALTALFALVLISCGGRSSNEQPQAATATTRPLANATVRRLLEGNGIGSVTFGQPRSAVRAELERLLGPAHETIPGICGFGASTDWIGLNLNSPEANLSAELNLSFKGSRFVGYAYLSSTGGPARQRHGLLLGHQKGADSRGYRGPCPEAVRTRVQQNQVAARDPSSAKLPRLPLGEISTASGEISGGIRESDALTASPLRAPWW